MLVLLLFMVSDRSERNIEKWGVNDVEAFFICDHKGEKGSFLAIFFF